jgi:plasmid stabilization system protein ParE
MATLKYHESFWNDLRVAVDYYVNIEGMELGHLFVDAVEEAIRRIELHPELARKVHGEVRRVRLQTFKAYSVRYTYDAATKRIFIGSLFHGARHPLTGLNRFKLRRLEGI